MTREDIIKLAREAGVKDWWDSGNDNAEALLECLERFTALVAAKASAAEREACAKVCETHAPTTTPTYVSYAAAIRARGETK